MLRAASAGKRTSRVLFLSDLSSSIPAIIQPTGQRALIRGDNSINPLVDFLPNSKIVRAGSRVITSGEGGVLPPNLLIGTIAIDSDGNFRVLLAADFSELNFLRVLISPENEELNKPGELITN